MNTAARRALYDNLGQNAAMASQVDMAIWKTKKDSWRASRIKEKEVKYAIKAALGGDETLTEQILELVKNQHEY